MIGVSLNSKSNAHFRGTNPGFFHMIYEHRRLSKRGQRGQRGQTGERGQTGQGETDGNGRIILSFCLLPDQLSDWWISAKKLLPKANYKKQKPGYGRQSNLTQL